jgi:hypothetical protein
MGGLLSQLVGAKIQREQDAFKSQLGMYKAVYDKAIQDPDSVTPGTLEAAANAIGVLAESQLGGGKGKGGKSGSGGGSGSGGSGGVGDLFKGLLTMGASNIHRQAGQQRESTQTAMKTAAAGMPKQIMLSADEREQLKLKQEQAEQEQKNQIALKYEKAKGEEVGREKLLENTRQYENDMQRYIQAGHSPKEAADLAMGLHPLTETKADEYDLLQRAQADLASSDPNKRKAAEIYLKIKDKDPKESATDKNQQLAFDAYKEKNKITGELSAVQKQTAIAEQKQSEESPDTKVTRQLTQEMTKQRLQDARTKAAEKATADASESTKAFAQKLNSGDIKITDIPMKDRGTVIAYMSKAGLNEPTALIPAAQNVLTQIDPVLEQIEAAKQELESVKNDNQNFYYAKDFLEYKLGKDTGVSGLIANLSMAGILGASRILRGGASRTKAIFEEAQQHTPSVWKDSPKLIYDKLTQMEKSIISGKTALYEEGRRSGVPGGPGPATTPAQGQGQGQQTPSRTATGPNGQKLGLINGQWVPLNGQQQ